MKMMKLSLVTLVFSQDDTELVNQEKLALEAESAKLAEVATSAGNAPDLSSFFGDDETDETNETPSTTSSPSSQSSSTVENSVPDNENVETSSPSSVSPDETSARVSCGAHDAATCAECVRGACADKADDNQCHESAWCNGDCVWDSNACTETTATVKSCGQHQAESCELCPPSNVDDESRFCHGDCKWDSDSCKDN